VEEFVPGQRWISNTELQLGLGCIIDSDHRTVTISFTASEETRTYAKENAPLSRIVYAVDETIQSIDGEQLQIISISEINDLINYNCRNQSGAIQDLLETKLDHSIQLNRPAERLFSGQIDKNNWFDLRYQTLKELNKLTHSELSGLTGCRTSLIPHQLYIAHEVANRHAPRVLLADEVGLGKTIEAGLIIHHLLLNERAQRVLIIVPESLIHQWLVEMLRRFNLLFSIFDKRRCSSIKSSDTQTSENPFLSEQLALCSVEFLSTNPDYQQQALAGEWDLMVVDEAHHLQWTEQQSSHEYQLIEQLSQQVKGVLLLTATPEQLGVESHFARLRLLDPDRFTDLASFIAEEKNYQPIAQIMEVLQSEQSSDKKPGKETEQLLKTILGDEYQDEQSKSKESIIEHLLDRHGTGRLLFRNTRNTIKGFPKRTVFAHPQKLPEEYQQLLTQFSQSFNEDKSLQANISHHHFSELVLFPEKLYQIHTQSSHSSNSWTQIDPRVLWLADWLFEQRSNISALQSNKILIITAHAQTAIELADVLKKQYGLHAAVFHEGLSLLERDRAAAFFADTENGTPLLICSEIGSEGRNFQFAHQMVLFDLPFNPDLLEQRIGRLDRIGQTQAIKIHVPYLNNSAQALLFHWYHEALNAFEQTCPGGHSVFTQVQAQLSEQLMNAAEISENTSQQKYADIIKQSRILHETLNQTLHDGRDQLLEYNSCRQPQADKLQTLAEKNDLDYSLFQYMDELFDAFGIDHSEHSEHCYIISPGEHMLTQFPGLPDDGMTITYQRSIALSNEDMQFFSWEHPMVRTAMDMISSSEMGNTAMTTLDLAKLNTSKADIKLKPGSILVECIFILETSAHKTLYANRYLPPTTIRIVLNDEGQDFTQKIKQADLKQGQEKINTSTAQQIIKIKQAELQQIIQQAENHCAQYTPEILQSAKNKSQNLLLNEIDRLKALAKINPNIREEEVNFFEQQLQSLEIIFNSIQPRLDALRVIICS